MFRVDAAGVVSDIHIIHIYYIYLCVSLFHRVVLSMKPEQQICSFKFLHGVVNFIISSVTYSRDLLADDAEVYCDENGNGHVRRESGSVAVSLPLHYAPCELDGCW